MLHFPGLLWIVGVKLAQALRTKSSTANLLCLWNREEATGYLGLHILEGLHSADEEDPVPTINGGSLVIPSTFYSTSESNIQTLTGYLNLLDEPIDTTNVVTYLNLEELLNELVSTGSPLTLFSLIFSFSEDLTQLLADSSFPLTVGFSNTREACVKLEAKLMNE